jgi:Tol biopolymer transport system component
MRRWTLLIALPLMVAFGFGVYYGLGQLKSKPPPQPKSVTTSRTLVPLPGAVYISQGGALYRLAGGQFTPMRPGPGAWLQPASAPNGQLIAVSRQTYYSDLYLLDSSGNTVKQLTKNVAASIELNHWAFYPNVSPDGKTLYYSYDPKDPFNNFRVDLAVWSMPLQGSQSDGKRRTVPNQYTGGDVQPLPLASGAVLYTKYSIDDDGHSVSQLWLQTKAGTPGQPITDAADNCSSPALSADRTRLALVCTGGKQTASVEVAPFDGQKLGPREVVVEGQLNAAPAWSPDGHSLLYEAPGGSQGHFQLWLLQLDTTAQSPSPSKSTQATPSASAGPVVRRPKMVTTDLDLDATSAPLWVPAAA